MVRRPVWRLSVAALFAASLVLACASTPQEEQGQTDLGGSSDGTGWEEPGGTSGGTTPGSGAMQHGTASGAVVGTQDTETQSLQMELKPVYFDYDRSTLRPDAAATLKANAEAIRNFPSWAVVTVEGNCDERGTEEYNLALGDRRADAVKRYLVTLGVPESRLRTVSYGELKPAVQGHDETAWSQNRRAEFQVSR
jgi:peptidoglycan-associated lipoprotein